MTQALLSRALRLSAAVAIGISISTAANAGSGHDKGAQGDIILQKKHGAQSPGTHGQSKAAPKADKSIILQKKPPPAHGPG